MNKYTQDSSILPTSSALPEGSPSYLQMMDFMPEKYRTLCLSQGEIINVKKGTQLFQQGDSADRFYIILQGAIKLKKNLDIEERQNTIVDLVGPGELLGALCCMTESLSEFPVTGICQSTCTLIKIPRQVYVDDWRHNSELMLFFNKHIHEKLKKIQNDRCIQRLSLEKKLSYFLTEKLAHLEGAKITRQDIADYIGVTQASVIRLLSHWTKEGLISTEDHEIKIHANEKLLSIWKN